MATSVTLKPNAIDISGSTSGTTTLQASAVAGTTTLTLPAATDTLVGKATTDTLTNKTLTGAAMNGTLGATTPSTVAATSITASTTLGVTGVSTLTGGAVIEGLTVGKGAGSVSTNTAVGASALAGNSTGARVTAVGYNAGIVNTGSDNLFVGHSAGSTATSGANNTFVGRASGPCINTSTASNNDAFGYQSLFYTSSGTGNSAIGAFSLNQNTTGSYNVTCGNQALFNNTTASNNTAVGYQAGYSNTVGTASVFIGKTSGYSTTGSYNTFVGDTSGYNASTGTFNAFFGQGSGYLITTGAKNTVIGSYSGNQGGLDIRTASNYIVLSDGDGNPRFIVSDTGAFSNGTYGAPSSAYVYNCKTTGASGGYNWYIGVDQAIRMYSGSGAITNSFSSANSLMGVAKDTSTSRSINCAGTVNQNGADYAEYMTKAGDFVVVKGDVIGINADGKLTNVFADAISFAVKSTDPGLVGGDSWFTEPLPVDETGTPKQAGDAEYDAWFDRMEAARATVDRIAFCGQVPVNVTGATAGQFIIPVNDNGAIKGEAVSNPTFEQYQQAVGKVIAIEQDGRARIIVKVA